MDKGETKTDQTRREFLKKAAAGISSVAVVVVMGEHAYVSAAAVTPEGEARPASGGYAQGSNRYVYLIDITKCIGCGSCVRACERENNVPAHFFRTWVERYMVSSGGHANVDSPNGGRDGFHPIPLEENITKGFFVPKICNHCTATPCVQLCPVGASFRSPEGVILVDEKRCIGCSYCVQACPYGSRFLHPETHTASKCTLCYHRITKGMLPACVQMCPHGVRQFGDTQDLHDRVAEIVATSQVHVLKPELMTEPNCFYLGSSKEVR